jgi:hypothetical protein
MEASLLSSDFKWPDALLRILETRRIEHASSVAGATDI